MFPGPLITLDDVTVRVGGRWLLGGLSWQIQSGQNWVIWGSNGAGKTTLAKALLGEAPVVRGRLQRHFERGAGPANPAAAMALVSPDQNQDLYRREQWLDEMACFSGRQETGTTAAQVLEVQGDQAQRQCMQIAGLLGLETLLAKPVRVLSAGEVRKLLIARALLKRPRLLILDEPYNGLDAASRAQLGDVLNRLGAKGVQMVLITHRPNEIPAAFTHLLHLENGVSRWQGPVRAFFKARVPAAPPADQQVPPPAGPWNPTGPQGDPDSAPLIRMRGVSVRYGDQQVLSEITWSVRAGENWALIGPNGAGKSTLLRLITGDNLQGYANDLILFGRPKGSGESLWQIKARIGYVGDDLQLRYQKKMSGFDVVCSGFFDSVGLYRRCTAAQQQTAQMWLDKTATRDLAPQLFAELSFGQQRMILIVRAMVKTPRLLILDEPCSGLDAANCRRLLEILDVIGRSRTTNLLYVSHRPDEMPACITHRLYLAAGRVERVIAARTGP
jgi:molybdate transport system ATP-binding protein